MNEQNDFNTKCSLCGGNHDVFEISGCFNRSIENILKSNPNHFKEFTKSKLSFTSKK